MESFKDSRTDAPVVFIYSPKLQVVVLLQVEVLDCKKRQVGQSRILEGLQIHITE